MHDFEEKYFIGSHRDEKLGNQFINIEQQIGKISVNLMPAFNEVSSVLLDQSNNFKRSYQDNFNKLDQRK